MTSSRRAFLISTLAVAGGAWASLAAARPYSHSRSRPSRRRVQLLIRDCERRTNAFVWQLDHALDDSRLDGTHRERMLNREARRLENAIDQVKREFERHEDFMEIREDVVNALDAGRDIDRAVDRHRFNRNTERAWSNLRRELNGLARLYAVRDLD